MRKFAEFNYGQRPEIDIQILGGDGNYHWVRALLDTGNDWTLINYTTAMMLGFSTDPKDYEELTYVQGVYGEPEPVMVRPNTVLKIGNTEPIEIDILISDTDQNLIGMKDISQIFDIVFSNDNKVYIIQDTEDGLEAKGYIIDDN